VLRAIRDAESRVMFSGYDTLRFKLFIWTVSALICAIAGALYTPMVGIINPDEMKPANSIEMVVWVAVGGRGTLVGPILGSGVVNGTKTLTTTGALADYWLFILGGLAIFVTLFFRGGLVDRESHEKLATGLSRFLGSQVKQLHVPILLPILMCLFVPSMTIVILALINTLGISTGVTIAALANSWLQIGLLSLPVYLVVKIGISMIIRRDPESPGVAKQLIESVRQQFKAKQMILPVSFVALLSYTLVVASNYAKPIGALVLMGVLLVPLALYTYQRDLLERSFKSLKVALIVYLVLLLLLGLFPNLLMKHGVYLGVLAVFVAVVLPFVPYVKSLFSRFSVGKVIIVVALVPILYMMFFSAEYFFGNPGETKGFFDLVVYHPKSIFLRMSDTMFGLSGKSLNAVTNTARLYFFIVAAIALAYFVKPYLLNKPLAVKG
jgi:hypothetical protein